MTSWDICCRSSARSRPSKAPSARARDSHASDPDLRHDAPRRHAARGHLALGGRQDPHRAAPRRAGVRLHRGRLARLESEGRGVLRARARRAVADRGDRGVRLHLPGAGRARTSDANIQALLHAQTPVCTVVGKTGRCTSPMCCERRSTRTCGLSRRAWRICGPQGRRVIYDAEHFFDGYKADQAYALETLRAAARGGAETVVLCDTNGGTMPWEIAGIVQDVKAQLQHPFGIHTHNDGECAVANTLAAVRAGAMQVQGTINGYGERCGNANLCSIIPDLELKLDLRCLPGRPSADAIRGVSLRGRGRQPRSGRPSGLRRQARVRAQGRHPRRRHAANGAELPAHRSRAGRQRDARRGERAVRPRQPAEQGGGIRHRSRAGRRSWARCSTRSRRSRPRASPSKPPRPRSR